LKTVVKTGNRVYPHTERASDVLNFFLDQLREKEVSLALNSPVRRIRRLSAGFEVKSANFSVTARCVLIATGGVSYPKTGSVGDGQQWAKALGHRVEAFRPGLVGFEVKPGALKEAVGEIYSPVKVKIHYRGEVVGETRGSLEIERWGLGGSALTDASRLLARNRWAVNQVGLEVLFPDGTSRMIRPLRTRPIKEAMVTVGGVALPDVHPRSMESRSVLDVDGPTGGYNLHAAFATARLAAESVARVSSSRKG
jgi:predicted flavoprotein YhiN